MYFNHSVYFVELTLSKVFTSVIIIKSGIVFWFFGEILTLSLPVLRWVGDNTDIPSSSEISIKLIVR